MMLDTALVALLATFWCMIIAYVLAMMARNLAVVDVFWGPAILVACTSALWFNRLGSVRGYVAFILVSLWALRLAVHLGLRIIESQTEDWRYARLRARWGTWTPLIAFFQVFVLQAVLAVAVALPVLWILASPSTPMRMIDWLAVTLWMVGFVWEFVADVQLTRFLHDRRNKGTVLMRGLWKLSRHPNYFGELTQWWALWLLATAVPGGWASVAGPVLLTILIVRVSGIALTESVSKRRPQYARYMARVPALIPRFLK